MKRVFLALLFFLSFAPLAFAATDCEHSCCRTYDGTWDDDFDDCLHPKTGFDTCVSDCEARVWASRPQGPGPASPENTYTCKVGFIIPAVLAAAFVARRA